MRTEQDGYARTFTGILRWRDVRGAREAVQRLDALYYHYAELRDVRGQHQAQLMALIGKSRAESLGRFDVAQVYQDWLRAHLETCR